MRVFEYDKLILHHKYDGVVFDDRILAALRHYFTQTESPCFRLIDNGVQFYSYVGIIQIGILTIVVLPKIDRESITNKDSWHNILIQMLKVSGLLKIETSSNSELRLHKNSIFELYIELFLQEAERLYHRGLIKRHRAIEGNCNALKGSLLFSKHVSKNIVHQERFYVKHISYDHQNALNQILLKTLWMLSTWTVCPSLTGRIQRLILDFPALPDITVNELVFEKLQFDRKSEDYREAITISKLLLLNYHPDVVHGKNHVLALMFDMNRLWEKFVLNVLKRQNTEVFKVYGRKVTSYWTHESGFPKRLEPDILVELPDAKMIIDTKWKIPYGLKASQQDVRQMLAYNLYFDSVLSILLYPGTKFEINRGHFENSDHGSCFILRFPILSSDGELDLEFGEKLSRRFQEEVQNIVH